MLTEWKNEGEKKENDENDKGDEDDGPKNEKEKEKKDKGKTGVASQLWRFGLIIQQISLAIATSGGIIRPFKKREVHIFSIYVF